MLQIQGLLTILKALIIPFVRWNWGLTRLWPHTAHEGPSTCKCETTGANKSSRAAGAQILARYEVTFYSHHLALTVTASLHHLQVISSLETGMAYYVRVSARNSLGYGATQSSSPTYQHPYEEPTAPSDVVLGVTSDTMLTVSRWCCGLTVVGIRFYSSTFHWIVYTRICFGYD